MEKVYIVVQEYDYAGWSIPIGEEFFTDKEKADQECNKLNSKKTSRGDSFEVVTLTKGG